MDDSLLAEFQAAFSVSGEVNDVRAPHPHYTLYKQKRDGFGDQEVRRKKLLEGQKARRRDCADYARRIAVGELLDDDEMEEGEGYDEVDATETETSGKKRKQEEDHRSGKKKQKPPEREKKTKKKYSSYRNQLMQSEWLVDVPADFESNWHLVVCPIGRRSLVIASRGTTLAYSRSGKCLRCFPSNLPGGCSKTHRTTSDYCILDCIYVETARTYFVLDLMCWNGHPVYDSDREFRSFWLKTKLAETADLIANFTRTNPFKFLPLTFHPCSKESLTQLFGSKWPVLVDGLLFFHKEAHYITGTSPLAVWLKAHMVPDILGVPVSQEFLDCAPAMSETKMETADDGDGARSEAKMETAAVDDAVNICSDPKMVTENDVSNCEHGKDEACGDQSPGKEAVDSATESESTELTPQTVDSVDTNTAAQ